LPKEFKTIEEKDDTLLKEYDCFSSVETLVKLLCKPFSWKNKKRNQNLSNNCIRRKEKISTIQQRSFNSKGLELPENSSKQSLEEPSLLKKLKSSPTSKGYYYEKWLGSHEIKVKSEDKPKSEDGTSGKTFSTN